MSEDEQIERLKINFLATTDTYVRKKAFDALAEYGNKGIITINELIDSTLNNEVKMYGLELIKRIKSKVNTDTSRPWKLEGDISSDED